MTESTTQAGRASGVKNLDFRAWSDRERHVGSIIVIVTVAVLLVIGIAVQFLAPGSASGVLWALFALVLLALAYEAGAVYYGLRAAPAAAESVMDADAEEDHSAWAPPGERDDAAALDEDADVDVLTLRCGVCATEFDVRDDGTRPLYHTCPECGTEGVLRGEAPGASATETEPETPASPWAKPQGEGSSGSKQEGDAAGAPAPAAAPEPAAPQVKRIKLRCPGCKHVFPVEDDGSRPLRTRCPSCSRLGEIRG